MLLLMLLHFLIEELLAIQNVPTNPVQVLSGRILHVLELLFLSLTVVMLLLLLLLNEVQVLEMDPVTHLHAHVLQVSRQL